MGAQMINIGTGETEHSVATGGAVTGWQTTETGAVGAAAAFETSVLALKPEHTLGAQMKITRRALKQTGAGLEAAIRRDMGGAIGSALAAIFLGTGADPAVGDPGQDNGIKKMLNTLSDRGHIPCVKSSEARTAPHLYSLASAVMLRTFAKIVETGRTYVYAQPVAEKVTELLFEAVKQVPEHFEMEYRVVPWRVLYAGIKKGHGGDAPNGTPRFVRLFKGDIQDNLVHIDVSVFSAGYIVSRATESYADFWARDLGKLR